uniref:Uncharacterized protein n=1 Tax=Lutzomyia longipalpis TaxID=7200 RepID=A0A1B0C9B6_LUTLO
MGRSPDSTVKKINLKHALDLDRRGLLHREFSRPPQKDTIAVPNNGYVVTEIPCRLIQALNETRGDAQAEKFPHEMMNEMHERVKQLTISQ